MTPNDLTLGIALMCSRDGVILEVMHDGLGIGRQELLGKTFPMTVASSSFQKALSFLLELREKRFIFDWECDLSVGGNTILTHCAGLAIEDRLLIWQLRRALIFIICLKK
ncbi:MAG: hypothetical protein ABJB66_21195 [Gemmatimonadaceae bacterium]